MCAHSNARQLLQAESVVRPPCHWKKKRFLSFNCKKFRQNHFVAKQTCLLPSPLYFCEIAPGWDLTANRNEENQVSRTCSVHLRRNFVSVLHSCMHSIASARPELCIKNKKTNASYATVVSNAKNVHCKHWKRNKQCVRRLEKISKLFFRAETGCSGSCRILVQYS